MNPESFLKTIYLGDRACKGLVIDSWERRFKLVVDEISRVRDASGFWNFYDAEDIIDGSIVFEGLREIRFEPAGPIPNDYINAIDVKQMESSDGDRLYEFSISVSSGRFEGPGTREVIITVVATDVYVEDPARPGLKIRT